MTPRARALWSRLGGAARWAPGLVLAVSGYLKATRPAAEFALTLESYQLFPASLIHPLARVVPWVELMTGAALTVGLFTRLSALVATALYTAFVASLGSVLWRRVPLDQCGCFGSWGPALSPAQTLVLDLGLLALALVALAEGGQRWSLDQWVDR